MNDFRFALRQLLKNPGFTAAAVLTLGLGIGVNTAIFNVGLGLLVRSVPGVRSPRALVQIGSTENGVGFRSLAYPDFLDLKRQVKALDLAACYDGAFQMGEGTTLERVRGAVVSGNYFELLGVRMAAGRALSPPDDAIAGAGSVAVISFKFWQQAFAGDPLVVGRPVLLNGFPFTVIGITASAFKGTERQRELEVWVPMSMLAEAMPTLGVRRDLFSNRGIIWHGAIGRLRPGFNLSEARTELETIAGRLTRAFPNSNATRGFAIVGGTSAYQRDRSSTRSAVALLLALAGLVLLGACASLANMQLVRALARRGEVGVRLALGADRGRLVWQFLTENLVLSAFAGGVALVLLGWLSNLAIVLLPARLEPDTLQLRPDAPVFVLSLVLTLLLGVASGLPTFCWVGRRDLTAALRESAAQSVSPKAPFRNALVGGQVALSLLLTVTAGLLERALLAVLDRHSELALSRVWVASVDFGPLGYAPAKGLQTVESLRRRLLELPGVEAAGLASIRPFHDLQADVSARPEGATERAAVVVSDTVVTPGYFKTLGISIREGRDFDARDLSSSPPVAVVDEATANRLWPGRKGLGRRLLLKGKEGETVLDVIGVVADSRFGAVTGTTERKVYLPYAQHYQAPMVLQVRAAGKPAPLMSMLRAELAAVDPNLPPFAARTLAAELGLLLAPERATAAIVGLFALLAVTLATIGIHGLVTWSVAQQTREFGVRLALGGRPSDIVWLVMKRVRSLLLWGLGLGTLLSLIVTPLLRTSLVGVSFADPVTYASVLTLLALVGGAAAYLPARRAARINPMEALRCE